MFYSQLYFKKKAKIHFLLYLCAIIVLFSSLVTFFLKMPKKTAILQSKLVRFEVVNLSSQQAGIYWETIEKEETWLNLSSQDKKTESVYHEEVSESNSKSRKLHFVLLSSLTSNSTYSVSIENKKGIYVDSKNKKYVFKTPSPLTRPVYMNPLYGKVYQLNGEPSAGAFVLIYIKNAYPLFAVAKESGEWLIPLSSLISKQTGKYFDIDSNMEVDASFFSEENRTDITSTLKQLSLFSQSISIGKEYDLSENGKVLSAMTTQVNMGETTQPISILYPLENALIPGQKPLLKGKGIVDADIYAYINSRPQYSFRTKVNNEGFWMISPKEPLQPGNYVLSLNTKDEKGNRVNLMRHFIIAKNGEQVLGIATAEPTIVSPTIRPSLLSPTSITPTISIPTPSTTIAHPITVTQAPTVIAYAHPTLTPTLAPTQVAGIYATAVPTPPTTGQSNPLYFFVSFMLLVSGGLLLFLF